MPVHNPPQAELAKSNTSEIERRSAKVCLRRLALGNCFWKCRGVFGDRILWNINVGATFVRKIFRNWVTSPTRGPTSTSAPWLGVLQWLLLLWIWRQTCFTHSSKCLKQYFFYIIPENLCQQCGGSLHDCSSLPWAGKANCFSGKYLRTKGLS